uniref:Putative secreted protein n=1 Tax=Anopheles marajoara TaxID=58244 RepID=A0A2M4C8L0_9DIPT
MLAGVSTIFWSLMMISRSVSMKSNTSDTLLLCPNTSSSPIMFSWCSSCSSLISLSAVRLIPSAASSRLPILIFFTATISFVSVSRALYTVANCPSPRNSIFS